MSKIFCDKEIFYETSGSSGIDLKASQDTWIAPHIPTPVSTGCTVILREDHEAQIRSRSSMALKGISVLNAPGTIDSDYLGEIKVILFNHNNSAYKIKAGDRIAQIVLSKLERFENGQTKNIDRKEQGFGSTGT